MIPDATGCPSHIVGDQALAAATDTSDGLAGERMRVQPPLRTPAANCKIHCKISYGEILHPHYVP